ncbi:hypothetical protein IRJ41_002439, partial [Triplophysa rosa]
VFGDEVKSVSAMEGENVTLHTDLTHIHTDDVIEWRFGVNGPVIARIKRSVDINPTYDNNETEIFRDRLKMNNQTGDLTITHITSQHSGLYHLYIFRGIKETVKRFSLTVNDTDKHHQHDEGEYSLNDMNSDLQITCVHSKGALLWFIITAADVHTPGGETHLVHIIPLSCAAVGFLMIVASLLMFFICRKHTNTRQQQQQQVTDQTREDEITYADPTFYKPHAQNRRVQEEDEVVYAGFLFFQMINSSGISPSGSVLPIILDQFSPRLTLILEWRVNIAQI